MVAAPEAVLVGLIVPQAGEHAAPFCIKVQVTPRLVPSFVTVAVNCCVLARATLTDPGDTDMEIAGRLR